MSAFALNSLQPPTAYVLLQRPSVTSVPRKEKAMAGKYSKEVICFHVLAYMLTMRLLLLLLLFLERSIELRNSWAHKSNIFTRWSKKTSIIADLVLVAL